MNNYILFIYLQEDEYLPPPLHIFARGRILNMEHKSASVRAIHTNKTEVIVIVPVKKDTFQSHLVRIVLVYGPEWSEKNTSI